RVKTANRIVVASRVGKERINAVRRVLEASRVQLERPISATRVLVAGRVFDKRKSPQGRIVNAGSVGKERQIANSYVKSASVRHALTEKRIFGTKVAALLTGRPHLGRKRQPRQNEAERNGK